MLQGVIFQFVFGKIQCFRLQGNALAGVIFKLSAFILYGFNAPFCAQDGILVQLGAISAVGAGSFHSFAKQHCGNPISDRYLNYTPTSRGMLLLFCVFLRKAVKTTQIPSAHTGIRVEILPFGSTSQARKTLTVACMIFPGK